MAGDEASSASWRNSGPEMAPPSPWELDVQIGNPVPTPVAAPLDEPLTVFGRERLISLSFGIALLLLALAVDAASGNARYVVIGLAGFALALGLRIWWTPVVAVEVDSCATSNHLLPTRRFDIDGLADLYLDGNRLIRRGDGRRICTLRPILLRTTDFDRFRTALERAGNDGPTRHRIY